MMTITTAPARLTLPTRRRRRRMGHPLILPPTLMAAGAEAEVEARLHRADRPDLTPSGAARATVAEAVAELLDPRSAAASAPNQARPSTMTTARNASPLHTNTTP